MATSVNPSATISRFAAAAQHYCAWIESAPGDDATEHATATLLVAELYAAALSLPNTEPTDDEVPSLSAAQREVVRQRLIPFPFQYYWEIFTPVVLEPDEPCCGDITDDLGDIYFDVKEGLVAYASNEQAAVWHWRFNFRAHWGRHAACALRVLHDFEPEASA